MERSILAATGIVQRVDPRAVQKPDYLGTE